MFVCEQMKTGPYYPCGFQIGHKGRMGLWAKYTRPFVGSWLCIKGNTAQTNIRVA